MADKPSPVAVSAPALPHWEQVPDDLPGAIRQVKAAIRDRIRRATQPL